MALPMPACPSDIGNHGRVEEGSTVGRASAPRAADGLDSLDRGRVVRAQIRVRGLTLKIKSPVVLALRRGAGP